MVEIGAILSALRLVDFGLEKLKGKLSKRQKKKVVESAASLIRTATDDEIDKYVAEPRRKTIDYLTGAAARPRPRKATKKAAPARRKGFAKRKAAPKKKR